MSMKTKSSVAGIEFLSRQGDPDKTLVMLHGIGSNAHTFDRLGACFPKDWTLLSWNAPGYGGSQPLSNPRPRAGDYAEQLGVFASELGLQRFSLIGHSLGTLIAAEFAAINPDRIDEVVLMSCAQGYGMKEGAELPEKAAARLQALKELGPQAFAEARAPNLMHDPEGQPDICRGAIEAMASINPDGYAQAVHMLAAGDLAARMPAVIAPCLLMVGSHDRITPPEQSRRAFEALQAAGRGASCSYREIADAGHIAHQEKSEKVASEIRAFVRFSQPSLEEAQR